MHHPFIILTFILLTTLRASAQVESITTDGTKWVASTWGYNAPKLLFDGKKLYAIALVGGDMDHCTARLYSRDETGGHGGWQVGADLSPVYQPATMVLDSEGRINVFTTKLAARGFSWRSKEAGKVDQFDQVELTDPEKFAFGYLGAASHGGRLMLAGLDAQYNMWLTVKQSPDAKWDVPILLARSQKEKQPWDSPVYPILLPDDNGVDVVYSNSPDGGIHNTYNRVEIVRLDFKTKKVVSHEIVAQGPVGEMMFGLDAIKLKDGTIHVLYITGLHVYGGTAPDIEQRRGLCCATRQPDGLWTTVRVTKETGTGQLYNEPNSGRLWAIQTNSIGAAGFFSDDGGGKWSASTAPVFSAPGQFLQTLKPTSGSVCDDHLRAIQSTASHELQYIDLTLPIVSPVK